MSWTYTEHEDFGPLKFGMSPDETISILGTPKLDEIEEDLLLRSGDRAWFKKEFLEFKRRSRVLEYEQAVGPMPEISVTFFDGVLSKIYLRDTSVRVMVRGENVLARGRRKITLHFAGLEEDGKVHVSGEDVYFRSTGLMMTFPSLWRHQGAAGFLSPAYMAECITHTVEEVLPADEITGKE